MEAVVVGAGIGGLATSIGLARAGWDVVLVERQPALAAAGAGLLMWSNAMHALHALGVGAAVTAAGVAGGEHSGLRRPDGRWLTRVDSAAIGRRLGAPVLAVHRADLHEILVRALPPNVTVRTGVELPGVPADGDLVVAADGVGSALRRELLPAVRLRDSGQVAWRAVVPIADLPPGLTETLGRGWQFGFAPVGRRGAYWFASGPGPLRAEPPAEQLAALVRRFAGWHAPIPGLLAATDPARLLHHPLADLDPVPPMRVGDRVAFVGDAGHAMTPHLGQGAAQALEDAVTLVAEVTAAHDPAGLAAALVRYDRIRRPRVAALVARSRRFGAVLGARGAFTSRLRDLALVAIPNRISSAGAQRTASWRPPALPFPVGPAG